MTNLKSTAYAATASNLFDARMNTWIAQGHKPRPRMFVLGLLGGEMMRGTTDRQRRRGSGRKSLLN
ncbi:hypothetical protein UB47_12475 [Pseudomonas sp. 5]|nr:hypothetical protein UB47_12475 [Pseudomonas sp. 5]